MSWPRANERKVACKGFPEEYFAAIQMAIDNRMVTWLKTDLYIGLCTAKFQWANCIWEMEELNECVRSIKLIEGTPNAEEMCFSVLKG